VIKNDKEVVDALKDLERKGGFADGRYPSSLLNLLSGERVVYDPQRVAGFHELALFGA